MAIKAYLDQSVASDGQPANPRTAERRALRLETSGFVGGGQDTAGEPRTPGAGGANVTIHNISAAGLLLETRLPLAAGDAFTVDLPEAGLVTATVVWRSDRLYGCAFERAIGAAALAAAQLQGFAPGVPTRPLAATAPLGHGDSLGTRLGRLRREAGLTLADVAAALGVSKPTVWAWEKGKARPLPERLDAIAAALGVAPEAVAPTDGPPRAIEDVISSCRQRIAEACGASPDAVRIMVEL